MGEIETVKAVKMGWLDLPRGTSYPTFPYMEKNRPPPLRKSLRKSWVRPTCIVTPQLMCGSHITDWQLATCQISAQSVQPFSRYRSGVHPTSHMCTCARAETPQKWPTDKNCLVSAHVTNSITTSQALPKMYVEARCARAHVHAPLLYLGNGWTDCA